jgi:hypothetical protein
LKCAGWIEDREMEKNWIVLSGAVLHSRSGGGFEFFGPYTEEDARLVRCYLRAINGNDGGDYLCLVVELVSQNLPDRIRRNRGGD